MNDKIKEYVRAWISKANSDMKNAQIILSAKDPTLPLDTVCFHCQQASEKYLKAYLVYHNRTFPHSHNLADIVAECIQVDQSFASIQRRAEILTPYAVEIHYPDDFLCQQSKMLKNHLPSQPKSKSLFSPDWI